MAMLKKVLGFLLGGAIVGAVAASFIVPPMIVWYDSPGPGVPSGFDLAPHTRSVISRLLVGQAIGAGIGAALLLVIGVLVFKAQAKRAVTAAPAVHPLASPPP
jgi:hypothetical protein